MRVKRGMVPFRSPEVARVRKRCTARALAAEATRVSRQPHDEHVEQPKRHRRHGEEVHRSEHLARLL